MSHSNNIYDTPVIVDRINDSVIADSYSPQVFLTVQLAASCWARIFR